MFHSFYQFKKYCLASLVQLIYQILLFLLIILLN